jgi:hypothetical protein
MVPEQAALFPGKVKEAEVPILCQLEWMRPPCIRGFAVKSVWNEEEVLLPSFSMVMLKHVGEVH